jgi:hypothetical protein
MVSLGRGDRPSEVKDLRSERKNGNKTTRKQSNQCPTIRDTAVCDELPGI